LHLPDEIPDTELLVRRAQKGDEAARDALLVRHRRKLKRLFRVWMDPRLAARVDPSDVVQETLLLAARRLDEYLNAPPLPFYAWLRQIGGERLIQLHREHVLARKRSVRREVRAWPALPDQSVHRLIRHLVSADAGPPGALMKKESQHRVRQALDRLSEQDRQILVLRHLEQLSTKEVAEVLQLSESAVKLRHFRAVRRIRELLDPSDHG
jgi:RNA polymerase sigma-70 factor (ECF subfamily)